MEIGPVAGSVRASTGAGRVRVTIADAGGKAQNVDVVTGTGTVFLELPANMDARFELETAYTRNFGRKTSIKSAWTLERGETSDWDSRVGTPRRYVRAIGVAGKGRGLVRVVSVNGDIEVRRGAL